MPEYSPEELEIVEQSLEELKHILQWVRPREENKKNPVTVLIGGWAVYSYNNYGGSLDIDLVTNNKTKRDLKWYLLNERGYEHYRKHGSHSVAKLIPNNKEIIIDFISRETRDPFEGRTEILNFHILEGHTEIKEIKGKVPAAVPTRSLLLLFKLKAAWDRAYRLKHKTSGDTSWESGKLIKDYADILALLDPAYGGTDIDIAFLGEQLTHFEFLKACLERIPDETDALKKYREIDRETARDTCNKLLLLL